MAEPGKIDRQTTAPFLLRLFYKKGAFHRPDDFAAPRLPQHLQIYTWKSCTMSELTHLLLGALPSLLPAEYAGTRVAFRLFFPDMQTPARPGAQPRFIARDLGSVIVGAQSVDAAGKPTDTDVDMEGENEGKEEEKSTAETVKEALKQLEGELSKTLDDGRFVIGDYISAAILPPLPDGSVAAVPPPPVGGRGPPPRDGYGGGRRGGREDGFGGHGDFGGFGGGGRGGRGGGRFEHGGRGAGFPDGEWRRGEAPPAREREDYWRGGGGGRGGRGRGRW